MAWIDLYRKACDEALADKSLEMEYIDKKPMTKCNFGFHQISRKLGDASFEGKVANQIHDMILISDSWIEVPPKRVSIALKAIENGGRAVAISRGCPPPDRFPSGHVAYLYPGNLGFSGKWEHTKIPLVPKVANIGKQNRVMGANEAFKDEPRYFYTEA